MHVLCVHHVVEPAYYSSVLFRGERFYKHEYMTCRSAPLKAQEAQRVGDSKCDETRPVTLIVTSAILIAFLLLLKRTLCAL